MTAEFSRTVRIEKIDAPLRIAWGWAYVCEDGGHPVVDVSGDVCEAREVQKGAHGFVSDSRAGSLLHGAQAGEIVDSIFFSKEVQRALGIDLGRVGWFIGYRIDDDAAWKGVQDGTYTAFSIGGSAETDDLTKWDPDQPRGDDGKWSSGGGGSGGEGGGSGGGGGGGGGGSPDDDDDVANDVIPERVPRELEAVEQQLRLLDRTPPNNLRRSDLRERERLVQRRAALREALEEPRGRGGDRGDEEDRRQTAEADAKMMRALRAMDRAEAGSDRAGVDALRRQMRGLHSEVSPKLREEYSERFRRLGVGQPRSPTATPGRRQLFTQHRRRGEGDVEKALRERIAALHAQRDAAVALTAALKGGTR